MDIDDDTKQITAPALSSVSRPSSWKISGKNDLHKTDHLF